MLGLLKSIVSGSVAAVVSSVPLIIALAIAHLIVSIAAS